MKRFSSLSIIRWVGPILAILLFANCTKEEIASQQLSSEATGSAQVLSQTRTGNLFLKQSEYSWKNPQTSLLAGDDNLFLFSEKLNNNFRAFMVIQDFRFEIPQIATITNVIVVTRRFKKGRGLVKDCYVHLTKDNEFDGWFPYGVQMAKSELWKTTESEVVFSQSGSGNNGLDYRTCLCSANQQYQWTPVLINGARFGVYLLSNFPDGGSAEVYYDQIKITVEYSMP